MLEILALIGVGKRIGAIVRGKGHSASGYQVLLVILWFGGEIFGAVFGGIVTNGQGGLATYVFALIGAAIGAGIAYMIANSVSSNNSAFYPQQQMPASTSQPPINSVVHSSTTYVAPTSSAEERLARLNELRLRNLITEQEFQERRQQILKDL